jgi:PIN domain-containing protein
LSDYYVILDTNVWVTERLLQSNVGSALLHALTETNARIGVPEVVETEVKNVLLDLADGAVAAITKNNSLLQQLSGQKLTYMAPTASAIKEGIEGRWKQLEGALTRIPFTFEQAKAALDRVMKKLPPSGPNNEQFRDCCIWETALSLASERTVHLITKDSAFYQGRTSSNGLASVLTQELANLRRDVRI